MKDGEKVIFLLQVHPDKCSCFGAERAFQILGEAVGSVLGSAEGGFVKDGPANEEHAWWDRWDGDAASRKRKRQPEPTPQTPEEELHLRSCTIDVHPHILDRHRSVAQLFCCSQSPKNHPLHPGIEEGCCPLLEQLSVPSKKLKEGAVPRIQTISS